MDSTFEEADIYLGRQPILDRQGRLTAYELLFRDGVHNGAHIEDADRATAQVLSRTLGEFGLPDTLNGNQGFVNVGRGLLMSDVLDAVPRETFVLEILEDVIFDEAAVARCRELRQAGYRLALDDVSPQLHVPDALLDSVEIVKIDLRTTPANELGPLVTRFRRAGKQVLAEKVETREEFRRAADLGCGLFQGYFFARVEVLNTQRRTSSRAPLLRLLAALSTELDVRTLEALLKATPDIVVHVLRLARTAGLARHHTVDTLRDAINVVGTSRIAGWVQLLICAHDSIAPLHANPMVQLVGLRARFMELAAGMVCDDPSNDPLIARASLTGMLSLMPVIFQMPETDLLDQVGAGPEIRAAIERGEGALGELLACAKAMETQDETTLATIAQRWPVMNRGALAGLEMRAALWMSQIAR